MHEPTHGERIIEGIERARKYGTKSGLPIGRPRAVFNLSRLIGLRNAGASWRTIASILGISSGTARSAYKAVQKPPARERGQEKQIAAAS